MLRLEFDGVDAVALSDELGQNATPEEWAAARKRYNVISREQAQDIAKAYSVISKQF